VALLPTRTAPAGGSGPGADQQPGRRLRFATGGNVDAVAGGLVAGVADVDLVQGKKDLAVVGAGFDHGPRLDSGLSGDSSGKQLGGGIRSVGDQDAGVAGGFGVDADDRLSIEVFGDIGDEAVLADDDGDVIGCEEESVEVASIDLASSPFEGDGAEDGDDGSVLGSVAGLDVGKVPSSGLKEEGGGLLGAVTGDESVKVRCAG
jgi:hypothetical protein